jgi:hypothetical protein
VVRVRAQDISASVARSVPALAHFPFTWCLRGEVSICQNDMSGGICLAVVES